MRRLLAGGLGLSLGLWTTAVRAQEGPSLPGTERSARSTLVHSASANELPIVTLGKPIAKLGKPVPIRRPVQEHLIDPAVRPAAFLEPAAGRPAQPANLEIAQPLPVGPSSDVLKTPGQTKQQTPEVITKKPQPLAPAPAPTFMQGEPPLIIGEQRFVGPVVEGQFVGEPIMTGTVAECDEAGTVCGEGCGCLGGFFARGNCFSSPYRVWVRGEYVQWWIKGDTPPVLVTSSPLGTPASVAGVLGQPNTSILYGGGPFESVARPGGKLSLGVWFDRDETIGMDGSGFFVGDRTVGYTNASNGSPILARPFQDAVTGLERSFLIAGPNQLRGTIQIESATRFGGADANLRFGFFRGPCWKLDFLAGYRYLNLSESMNIVDRNTFPVDPLAPIDGTLTISDSFETSNDFNGGQIGLDFELRRGRWALGFTQKIAFGNVHEQTNISGNTLFTVPGTVPASVNNAGLLALPTNVGTYTQNKFGVVPETGVTVSYQLTDHLRAFVSYNLIYLSEAARPGGTIDRVINTAQVPVAFVNRNGNPGLLTSSAPLIGPARPTPLLGRSDFWAQGVGLGLEFRY